MVALGGLSGYAPARTTKGDNEMTVRKTTMAALVLFLGIFSIQLAGCGGSDDDVANETAKPLEKTKFVPMTKEERSNLLARYSWDGDGVEGDVGVDFDACVTPVGEASLDANERMRRVADLIECMAGKGWKFQ